MRRSGPRSACPPPARTNGAESGWGEVARRRTSASPAGPSTASTALALAGRDHLVDRAEAARRPGSRPPNRPGRRPGSAKVGVVPEGDRHRGVTRCADGRRDRQDVRPAERAPRTAAGAETGNAAISSPGRRRSRSSAASSAPSAVASCRSTCQPLAADEQAVDRQPVGIQAQRRAPAAEVTSRPATEKRRWASRFAHG